MISNKELLALHNFLVYKANSEPLIKPYLKKVSNVVEDLLLDLNIINIKNASLDEKNNIITKDNGSFVYSVEGNIKLLKDIRDFERLECPKIKLDESICKLLKEDELELVQKFI